MKRIKDADNLFKGHLCYVVKDVSDGDVDEIQVCALAVCCLFSIATCSRVPHSVRSMLCRSIGVAACPLLIACFALCPETEGDSGEDAAAVRQQPRGQLCDAAVQRFLLGKLVARLIERASACLP